MSLLREVISEDTTSRSPLNLHRHIALLCCNHDAPLRLILMGSFVYGPTFSF